MKGRCQTAATAAFTVLFCPISITFALSTSQLVFPPVQQISVADFRHQFPTGSLDDQPVQITDVMSVEDCERLCDEWIQAVGDERITVQRKRCPGGDNENKATTTQLYQCTVAQSLDLMMQSTPQDSIFSFVEGLLDSTPRISAALAQTREGLFDDPNWFDYFPQSARPSDCVVMAGEGATSTLHRDPFEWTGTSLCLEGTKIWRFLDPKDQGWDGPLQSYRLNSTAWNSNERDDDLILSAGWQSDMSLYHTQQKDRLPSAQSLADMPNWEAKAHLQKLASTTNQLSPPDFLCTTMEGVSAVQYPGQMILIPPYWYHQTYAAEPSLAVASQRCGSRVDAVRVLNHILSLQESSQSLPEPLKLLLEGERALASVHPETVVDLLFEHLKTLRKQ